MQKYHVGDVVMLNGKPLPDSDRRDQLLPGTTGVVQIAYCRDGKHFRYEVQWDSPDELLNSGWWVYESNIDPVLSIAPIDLEELL